MNDGFERSPGDGADALGELRNAGRLSDEEAGHLRWLDASGAFIGNTDRHQFNVNQRHP